MRQAWIYFSIKHEPLEAALLRDPQRVSGGAFDGYLDLKLSVELANPWPARVWTLFRVYDPSLQSLEEKVRRGFPFYGDGERIRCTGYAAPYGRDVVIVSMAPPEMTMLACRQLVQFDRAPSFGWMHVGTEGDAVLGHGDEQLTHEGWAHEGMHEGLPLAPDGTHLASPAVQAMLLPQRAEGAPGVMVVLGEHCLRVDPTVMEAAKRCGSLSLEVIQCVGLKVHGLELPLEDASPVELCCSAGAEVLTTADASLRRRGGANRSHAGRAFEWQQSEHRTRLEGEHAAEGKRHVCLPFAAPPPRSNEHECIFPGTTCVVQGGRELLEEATPVPSAGRPMPLTCTMLSYTRARVPLKW